MAKNQDNKNSKNSGKDPDAQTMKQVHDGLKANGWTKEDIAAVPALNDLRKFAD